MSFEVCFCFALGDCNFISFLKEKNIHTVKNKLITPINSSLTRGINVHMHMRGEAKRLSVENAL